jgi:hypothetical protein
MQSNSAGLGGKKDLLRPEDLCLGGILAGRLVAPSGLAPEQLKGLTLTEITTTFPYGIDPKILFFRKVCGTVVKADSGTGGQAPFSITTVRVEDTEGYDREHVWINPSFGFSVFIAD